MSNEVSIKTLSYRALAYLIGHRLSVRCFADLWNRNVQMLLAAFTIALLTVLMIEIAPPRAVLPVCASDVEARAK